MTFEAHVRRSSWAGTFTVAAVAVVFCAAVSVRADEIHLTNGATIEGVPVEDGGDILRLRTPSGVLGVPGGVIARQVPGPTRWTRYQRARAGAQPTASGHVELARWCAENNLPAHRDRHIKEALALDPTCPEALLEAGYVPVGEVWIKALFPLTQEERERLAAARRKREAQIVEHLLRGWQVRIRAITDAYLKSGPGGRGLARSGFGEGRRRLLGLDDPLALAAACRVLSGQDSRSRLLLVERLGGSETDLAGLNLFALELLDDDAAVRAAATDALAERKDPRVSRQLRAALSCRNDRLVRRVADALGRMRDRSAVPELIDALHISALSDEAPDIAQVFDAAEAALAEPVVVPIGEQGVAYPSKVAVVALGRAGSRKPSRAQARPGSSRTEVQEALIAITGENYGFDEDAWRRWLRENPPLPQITP